MNHKNIIWLSTNFGTTGGINSVLETYISGLEKRGYKSTIICNKNYSRSSENKIIELDTLKQYTARNPLAKKDKSGIDIKYSAKKVLVPFWLTIRNIKFAATLIKAPRNSIIFSVETRPSVELIHNKLVSNIVKIKKIKTVHQFHSSPDSPYVNKELEMISKIFDRFVVLSEVDAEIFKIKYNRFIDYIDNPSPAIPKTVRKKKKVIIVASRLSGEKNIDKIIQAFTKISSKYPDWKLKIYGDGPEKESVKRLADLDNAVAVCGNIERESLLREFSESSLHAMFSDFEGMPMSILEAAACGTPTISNSSSAAVSSVVQQTGYLCKENSVEAYSSLLDKVLCEIDRGITRKDACLNFSEKNNLDRSLNQLENILRK